MGYIIYLLTYLLTYLLMADQVAVVLYTNSSNECYQLATVTVCLQHLTVAIQHAKVVHSNTVKRVWKCARIRKWGPYPMSPQGL